MDKDNEIRVGLSHIGGERRKKKGKVGTWTTITWSLIITNGPQDKKNWDLWRHKMGTSSSRLAFKMFPKDYNPIIDFKDLNQCTHEFMTHPFVSNFEWTSFLFIKKEDWNLKREVSIFFWGTWKGPHHKQGEGNWMSIVSTVHAWSYLVKPHVLKKHHH